MRVGRDDGFRTFAAARRPAKTILGQTVLGELIEDPRERDPTPAVRVRHVRLLPPMMVDGRPR